MNDELTSVQAALCIVVAFTILCVIGLVTRRALTLNKKVGNDVDNAPPEKHRHEWATHYTFDSPGGVIRIDPDGTRLILDGISPHSRKCTVCGEKQVAVYHKGELDHWLTVSPYAPVIFKSSALKALRAKQQEIREQASPTL